jgi:hypothetical protein
MTELNLAEMRELMLEALRRESGTQSVTLQNSIAAIAADRGLLGQREPGHQPPSLPREHWETFRDVLWGLIVEGVVAFGKDSSNTDWPWLSLTRYGREVVASEGPTPNDPQGYLGALSADRPLDSTELRFASQALQAYLRNLPDAAAVMLGAAAEHLLTLVLLEIAANYPSDAEKVYKAVAGPASKSLAYLSGWVASRASMLPVLMEHQREIALGGIGQLIRLTRNEAGHPSGGSVTRDVAFAMLQMYRSYREWLSLLRDLISKATL